LNLDAYRINDAASGCGDFRTDAFAGNYGDFVWHSCIVLYAKVFTLSKHRRADVARKERALCG
jgi:hypothetical protein